MPKPEIFGKALSIISSQDSFEIRAKPASGREELFFDDKKDVIVAFLKEPAEDGKANSEMIKLLKRASGRDFKIISGFSSKRKIIMAIKY
jgi:uncharacterized protein (TIGR00251 family)